MKKIHRFIIDQPLTDSTLSLHDPDVVHQIFLVLRLKAGEQIELCDGRGMDALGQLSSVSKKSIEVKIEKRYANTAEPEARVTLYCAILKRENFEYVAQKATEVGVSEIVPIRSARTVKLDFKVDRLKNIVREAAEQSGRGRVPIVHLPVTFAEALKMAQANELNVFFEPTAGGSFQDLQKLKSGAQIGVWIGPEGGWTEEEISLAEHAGFQNVRLGRTVLRAETAATVGSFLALFS